MVEGNHAFVAVCANGHVRRVSSDPLELNDDRYCTRCTKQLHTSCPECTEPVIARRYAREDGTVYWKARQICENCGNAYPWGPNAIQQWFRRNIPTTGSSKPRPSGVILTQSVRVKLEDSKYGEEVIKYVQDGDKCYRNRLWLPSLTMYVHAIEWAIIAFLKDRGIVDVVEKEREGTLYYLASGPNSLLNELKEHSEVDQKTLSYISNINRLERRWAAHHKSGDVLQNEVDSVRKRLELIVEELFGNSEQRQNGN